MINFIRKSAYTHGYLIITAAWLYTISFIFSNYWSYNSSPLKVQNQLEQQLSLKEKQFDKIVADTVLLKESIKDTSSFTAIRDQLIQQNFGLFIYTINDVGNPILAFWNSNHYYVDEADLKKKDGNYFADYQNGDFEFIKKSIHLQQYDILVVGLIPIRWDYFMENKYLNAHFEGYPSLEKRYQITTDSTAFNNSYHGEIRKPLFKIKFKEGISFIGYDWFTIVLRSFSLILLLVFFKALAQDIVFQFNFLKGFSFLLATFLLLRLVIFWFPFPFDFKQLPLFDPGIYASNAIHPSLGDLLINSILFFWVISFYKYNYASASVKTNTQLKTIFNQLKVYSSFIVLVVISFLLAAIMRSLVLDSKISFDVMNFSGLNIYTFISIVILCLLVLSFFNISHILFLSIYQNKIGLYQQIIIIAIVGLSILSFNFFTSSSVSNIFVLVWLIVYTIILNYRKKDLEVSIFQSSFFIFWVMFFAISVSTILMSETNIVELAQRKRIAENLTLQTDPIGESLLDIIATTNFTDNFLKENFSRFNNPTEGKLLKDSLIEANFSGYLNKYDTRIYTYDSLYHALNNDDSTRYATIKTLILAQAKFTGIEHLYSYENADQLLTYLFEKNVNSENTYKGTIFIVMKPKPYVSEAIYPELFKQSNDLSTDLNLNYSYAVYKKNKLIIRFNDYNFPQQLFSQQIPYFNFVQKRNNGFDELWYNSGNGKQVLVVKKENTLLSFISLFAYLFCSFLVVIVFIRVADFIFQSKFKWSSLKKLFNFSIRSQIHITFIFISVLSFLIIAIATISFFIVRFNRNNEERLSHSIQTMASEIELKMQTQLIDKNTVSVNDIGFDNEYQKAVADISETHNVDLNLFDAAGNLRISTQPYIYNKKLLSNKIDPIAFEALHFSKATLYSQKETIGNLSYLSIYAPIVDGDGDIHAYLNIPYLNSQAELNQEISGFIATLINLNAFIFLIAGAIAFLITNRITASFKLIGNKMKQISLGKVNEVIQWNSNDEIGILVNEYNIMVEKLENSAKALAQSERQGAWREMARQVAHEIKNPLTPMKLSIQYLQKAINSGSSNVKELSQQVAKTLIEQIDQLSKIAGDFSQFANIGNATLEKFDITEVIDSLIILYKTDLQANINWKKEKGNYYVFADKTQLNRLFTNLIKNAIEASYTNKPATIHIIQSNYNNKIRIAIVDKGKGIPYEIKDKIFAPNFTTKSSGTGLGLAICKGIVEKINGMIWFEANEDNGTTFFIELPIVQ